MKKFRVVCWFNSITTERYFSIEEDKTIEEVREELENDEVNVVSLECIS